MYIRIQISKLPNQAKVTATRKENREEKENIHYTYICTFLAPPAYMYVQYTILQFYNMTSIPSKKTSMWGLHMYMNIHTYVRRNIYSRSTIGPLPILGMQVYLQYIIVLVSIYPPRSFASYQLGPGPVMWDLGEISPRFLPFSFSER